MRRALIIASAATTVAAFGFSGCATHPGPTAPSPGPATTAAARPADPAPLPPPEALTDVLYRLADPAVPGAEKILLFHDGAAPDGAAAERFAAALRDGGFAPVTFTAGDLRWSDPPSGALLATITVTPRDETEGAFTFPMAFHQGPEGWQLTRDTAEMLLAVGGGR